LEDTSTGYDTGVKSCARVIFDIAQDVEEVLRSFERFALEPGLSAEVINREVTYHSLDTATATDISNKGGTRVLDVETGVGEDSFVRSFVYHLFESAISLDWKLAQFILLETALTPTTIQRAFTRVCSQVASTTIAIARTVKNFWGTSSDSQATKKDWTKVDTTKGSTTTSKSSWYTKLRGRTR